MSDFLDVDATLEDWNALRATTDFTGLLVGNGASRAVWDDFGYDSLFENARSVEEKPLSPSELSVFDAMQTRSFEQVLGALKTTSRVNKALAVSSAAPRNRYYAIKEALINTVHAVHIPWRLVQAFDPGDAQRRTGALSHGVHHQLRLAQLLGAATQQ